MGSFSRWVVVCVVLTSVIGCGDETTTPYVDLGPRDLGPDVGRMDGGRAMDMGMEDLGPPPECMAPGRPMTAFVNSLGGAGPFIFAENFLATCQLTAGARTLSLDTLGIVVINELGVRVQDLSPVSGSLPDSWEGMVGAGGFPAGHYRIRCYVEDDAGSCSQTEVPFSVDGGPTVTIQTPTPSQPFSGGMTARFRIAPDELFSGDAGAALDSFTLTVAGAEIPAGSITDLGGGSYQANIDFANTALYPIALSGSYLMEVEATNVRGASARAVVSFIVDTTGPVITFLSPNNGQLVGGVFDVRVRIVDPLGVVPGSTVTVGTNTYTLIAIPGVANEYLQTIDANGFGVTVRELTINVVAQDMALNGRVASRSVKLDSQPPIASLDPGPVRYQRASSHECSYPMDPVGADAANDLQVLGTAAEFRARAEDQANVAFGGSTTADFLAGLSDTSSVSVYVLDDTTQPLLVDTDGDGYCDNINPLVDPEEGVTSGMAVVIDLNAIAPSQLPTFGGPNTLGTYWPADPQASADPAEPSCVGFAGTPDGSAPPPICNSSDLSWVMRAGTAGNVRTIFGKPPILPVTCHGDAWDFQSSIAEGWACVAVRARDQVGNIGVSPVLRNCFVSSAMSTACNGVPVGSYMPNNASVPSCTDGCMPPPDFDAASGFNVVPILP